MMKNKLLILFVLISGLARAQENIAPSEPIKHTYKIIGLDSLKAYFFYPLKIVKDGHRPSIAIFHGGGWVSGEAASAFGRAKHFTELGLVGIAVQYRLSNFKDITPVQALEDTKDFIIWLRQNADSLGIDPDRIVGEGWSAGGHLITSAAFFPDTTFDKKNNSVPNAIILKSPALDVEGWCTHLLTTSNIEPKTISPLDNIKEGMFLPSILILQGRTDHVTPTDKALLFQERMKAFNYQCELVVYEECGHLFTPSNIDDTNGVYPDKEISKRVDEKVDEFLRNLGYIEK